MSRPTLELTRYQLAELRRYADGEPHRFEARPNTNLIRRNMLARASVAGYGFYRLTPYGRAALDAAAPEPEAVLLADAEVWPRDERHRYRVYLLAAGELTCVAACPRPGGIGVALVQLDDDERAVGSTLSGRGAVGVLDAVERRWIVKPFPRKETSR